MRHQAVTSPRHRHHRVPSQPCAVTPPRARAAVATRRHGHEPPQPPHDTATRPARLQVCGARPPPAPLPRPPSSEASRLQAFVRLRCFLRPRGGRPSCPSATRVQPPNKGRPYEVHFEALVRRRQRRRRGPARARRMWRQLRQRRLRRQDLQGRRPPAHRALRARRRQQGLHRRARRERPQVRGRPAKRPERPERLRHHRLQVRGRRQGPHLRHRHAGGPGRGRRHE